MCRVDTGRHPSARNQDCMLSTGHHPFWHLDLCKTCTLHLQCGMGIVSTKQVQQPSTPLMKCIHLSESFILFSAVRHRHQQSIQRECTLHPLAESQDCKHRIHCPSSSSSMWGSFGKHLHFQGCKQKPHSCLSWRACNQHCMSHNDSFGFARSAGHMCYNRHLPLLSRKMLHRYHWTTSCSLHCRSCTCCLLHRSYTNGLVLPHTSSSGLR